MPPEKRSGDTWHVSPASENVVAGRPDSSEPTPILQVFQPTAPASDLPDRLPAGSIIGRHWFGVVDHASLAEEITA
jgi:hypothetical protein